ncbi:sister chromatid cohesion 1 protein 1-like [Vicia villosa]|uniref:sister chromatid cohesion 1 protein 1-like n=1 Tax=Vicia villosa TaxID=3911 RepID=UPI00273BE86F|nr:sister chromatid cohesion 1 protein 1-like [Vicia villosa]
MHKKKINREELNSLNVANICYLTDVVCFLEGIVTVFQKKVNLLHADVWEAQAGMEIAIAKKNAKKAPVNDGDKEYMTLGEIMQINVSPTKRVQRRSLRSLTLDNVDLSGNEGGEEEVPMIDRHQAAPASITLIDSYQTNVEPQFERFGIEGDDGTQVNDEFPAVVIPSPSSRDDPKRADITEDRDPVPQIIQQDLENINAREEPQRVEPANRKRRRPIKMDMEQQKIPLSTLRLWQSHTSDIKRNVGHGIQSTTNIVNFMGGPLHALGGFESYQSYSDRAMQNHPLEPSSTSPPGVDNNDFAEYKDNNFMIKSPNVKSFEEPDGNIDNQLDATEKERTQINDNGLRVPESTLQASSSRVPESTLHASSSTVPEHGHFSQLDLDRER